MQMAKEFIGDAQPVQLSRKCNSKSQGITSHLSERLLSKRQKIVSVGEDEAKKEPPIHGSGGTDGRQMEQLSPAQHPL